MQTTLEVGLLEQGAGDQDAHIGRPGGEAEHDTGQERRGDEPTVGSHSLEHLLEYHGEHATAVHDTAERHGHTQHPHVFEYAHHAAAVQQRLHGFCRCGQIMRHADLEAGSGREDTPAQIESLEEAAERHGQNGGQDDGGQNGPTQNGTGDKQQGRHSQQEVQLVDFGQLVHEILNFSRGVQFTCNAGGGEEENDTAEDRAGYRGVKHVPDVFVGGGSGHSRRQVGRVGQGRQLVADVTAAQSRPGNGCQRDPQTVGNADHGHAYSGGRSP